MLFRFPTPHSAVGSVFAFVSLSSPRAFQEPLQVLTLEPGRQTRPRAGEELSVQAIRRLKKLTHMHSFIINAALIFSSTYSKLPKN